MLSLVCDSTAYMWGVGKATTVKAGLLLINKFWCAIIFGKFGKLRVFANICRANIRKLR